MSLCRIPFGRKVGTSIVVTNKSLYKIKEVSLSRLEVRPNECIFVVYRVKNDFNLPTGGASRNPE